MMVIRRRISLAERIDDLYRQIKLARLEYLASRRHPPVAILQDVPAFCHQQVIADPSLEKLGHQARSQSQLVAFIGQGQLADLARRKRTRKIIFVVKATSLFDEALLHVTGGGLLFVTNDGSSLD